MARRSLAVLCSLIVALPLAMLPLARAEAPDPGDVAAGFDLFRKKAGCQTCHGWAGDGRKIESQAPDGADLRETKLDRANVIMTIKCGRPPTEMPAFDKFAYMDGRCYGLKQADLTKSRTRLPDPPATLTVREIDNIADFLFAKVIGHGPMNHAKCVAYWGHDIEVCTEFPK